MQFRVRKRVVDLSATPLVMGVLNVTPDSFSDGRDYLGLEDAVARAVDMIAEGADIIDVGPESTRPGSEPVPTDQQIARAVPVIEAVRRRNDEIAISIDARLAEVARAALDAGADMINDTSALRDDPAMADLAAASGAPLIMMHRRGTPANMQKDGGPRYDDLMGEIRTFFEERLRYAADRGIDRSRVIIDPGIGFGKRVEHNLLILRDLDRLVSLGRPVLVGASRKSFIGHVLAGVSPACKDDAKARGAASLGCAVVAVINGASILRVHDVRSTVEAIRMCLAIEEGFGSRLLPEREGTKRGRNN